MHKPFNYTRNELTVLFYYFRKFDYIRHFNFEDDIMKIISDIIKTIYCKTHKVNFKSLPNSVRSPAAVVYKLNFFRRIAERNIKKYAHSELDLQIYIEMNTQPYRKIEFKTKEIFKRFEINFQNYELKFKDYSFTFFNK